MRMRRIPRDKRNLAERAICAVAEWNESLSERLGAWGREYNARALCRNLALGGTAFLLGGAEMYFSASPFGVAFLCAAPSGIPYILIGVLLSGLMRGEEALVFSLSAVLAVGLRILVRCVVEPPRGGRIAEALFGESTYLRMTTAAVSAFAFGFYRAFVGGFYIYDLGGCITATAVAPVLTALFIPLFAGNEYELPEKDTPSRRLIGEAAYVTLLLCLTVAARGIELTGLSPVHIAVSAAVLYTVRTRGAARGVTVGLLCGAVAGFDYALVYALGAMGASLFMNLSLLAAATAVPVCGAVRSALLSDATGFITLFPSQVAGLAIFCLISLFTERIDFASPSATKNSSAVSEPMQSRARMQELSEAFSKLADSFSELARERRRPAEGELRAECDRVCDKVCLKCPKRNLCWNLEYASTLDIISKICKSVSTKGYVEESDLPEYIRRRCPSLDAITEGVNNAATRLIRDCLEDSRLSGFSADYRAVSAALAEAVFEDERETSEDIERTDRVRRVFDRANIKFSSLSVTGKRRVVVRAENVSLARATVKAKELREMIEQAVGVLLGPPVLTSEGRGMRLELAARRRFSVSFGAARSSAEKGDPCGDSICSIDSGEDYFYAVICDGMGQGSRAAFASSASIGFLKQMLEARMSVETSLSVLNAWLRADREECSVSIDILRVDLLTGKAAMYKSGAAPSFLRRGREVFPIESEGFPVGILKQTSSVRTDLELFAGDLILMGSDGIDPDGRILGGDEVWLLDLLESVDPSRPDSMTLAAKRTVSAARQAGSEDDIGALYVALREEPFEEE